MTAPDPIIVQGYSERYAAAFRKVLGVEGGYVDDAHDMGGATRFGVSLRYLKSAGQIDLDHDGFADFDLDFDGDIDAADIRKLTVGDARYLFHRDFWVPMQCDSFARPLGEMLFDQGVNGGASAAKKLLQKAINAIIARYDRFADRPELLKVDGDIGEATRRALEWALRISAAGMPAIVTAYRDAAKARYLAIVGANPKQQRFLKGWLARADELGLA